MLIQIVTFPSSVTVHNFTRPELQARLRAILATGN
jgi:hypothetical protein